MVYDFYPLAEIFSCPLPKIIVRLHELYLLIDLELRSIHNSKNYLDLQAIITDAQPPTSERRPPNSYILHKFYFETLRDFIVDAVIVRIKKTQ